jgi:hypothetical protein
MTSKHEVGQTVHIPFWLVLDLLDASPHQAFCKGTVAALRTEEHNGPSGPVQVEVADVNLGKPGLDVTGIQVDNLLRDDELEEWARNIAAWFLAYPEQLKASQS